MKLTIFTALLLILAGCGQSGPLYVPGDPSTIESSAGQTPSQNNDDEDDDEDANRR